MRKLLRKSTRQPKKKSEDLSQPESRAALDDDFSDLDVTLQDGLEEVFDEADALNRVMNNIIEDFTEEELDEMFGVTDESQRQAEDSKEDKTIEITKDVEPVKKPEPMQEMPKIKPTGLNQPKGEARKVSIAGNYGTKDPSQVVGRKSGKLEGRVGSRNRGK